MLNFNRPRVPDDLIGEIDRLFNLFVRRIVDRDINFAFMFEHAKALRGRVEQADKGGRKDVLAGVLLDMIEPAQPINPAVN